MKEVLVISEIHDRMQQSLERIEGYQFHFYANFFEVPNELKEKIEIYIGAPKKEEVDELPNLKWVQLVFAGANTYGWLQEDILLSNAKGGYGKGIAEHMLGITLMAEKYFLSYYDQQKENQWKPIPEVKLISEAKILSVGMGDIGSEYLKRCHMLGATCFGVRRNKHEKPDYVEALYTMNELDEILPECDVVALSLPETNETKQLFDLERLRKMKKDAILINVGRGSAIVEKDLLTVLKEGYFHLVALDVCEIEPLPQNNPLWNADRVFITPHISGRFTSVANYKNVMKVICDNLENYLKEDRPKYLVNRKLGY